MRWVVGTARGDHSPPPLELVLILKTYAETSDSSVRGQGPITTPPLLECG